jgi:hypothetical protein
LNIFLHNVSSLKGERISVDYWMATFLPLTM